MKSGVYLSKCGNFLVVLECDKDYINSLEYPSEIFPMNLTRLRKEFVYLGVL